MGPAQAPAGVPGLTRDAPLEHARLAHGQPADARAVDDLTRGQRGEARRDVRDLARGPGRLRPAQPPARDQGLRRGRAERGRAGSRRRARARRGPPRRHHAREARAAAGRLRRGRHRHGRQLVATQRRREHDPDRRRAGRQADRPRAAGARGRGGRSRGGPRRLRHRPRRGGERRARARGNRLGRCRGRRAQRGLRVAVARLPRRLAGARPRAASTSVAARSRSATRWARRARGCSAVSRTSCMRAAAATV